MKSWKELKAGDVVYLPVNPDVIPKGYLALEVTIRPDGLPSGQEPGDHMKYRLDRWFDCLLFEEPKGIA